MLPEQLETLRQIAEDLGLERQRLERIQLGFGFPPDSPDIFPFLDANFREADRVAVHTTPKAKDLDAIATWVREARARADVVLVNLHAHEQGSDREEPAAFIRTFAHRMIDEGADVVVGHGPHLLRGGHPAALRRPVGAVRHSDRARRRTGFRPARLARGWQDALPLNVTGRPGR